MKTFDTDPRTGDENVGAGQESEQVRAALITDDDDLREVVFESIQTSGLPVTIGLDVIPPAGPLDSEHMERLRSYDPHVVILHMGNDPERGIRAAGTISAGVPHAALVGLGPELDAARLLDAMRAGLGEYVPAPLGPGSVRDALERVMRKSGWTGGMGGRRNGQLLAFFSPKGGAGSTTVITNVGIELHRLTGKKTLLVDLDLELGEIASHLGVQARFHFVDLVRNIHRMDGDLLASYIEAHKSGVHVLSAPFEPEIGEEVGGDQIARILGMLRRHYDYVLVDTSKSLAPPALAALRTADPIFLVTNMDVPSLRNLKRCLPILDGATAGDAERLRLVVNRYNAKSLVSLDDIEETLGIEVYWTLTNDFDSVITSISAGQPLVLQGSSRYAEECKALARDIASGAHGATRETTSVVSRVLSRLRSLMSRTGSESRNAQEVLAHD
ncbi:MAG: AAA family ATPase [Longimicrobiales bacterium]|nr:AAA family ATPase [Longimicrobiales bacterium]